jgi:hypothetical protein
MAERFNQNVSSEIDILVEAGRQQVAVVAALAPVIEAIDTDDKREATQIILGMFADKLSTPEGLTDVKDLIAESQQE